MMSPLESSCLLMRESLISSSRSTDTNRNLREYAESKFKRDGVNVKGNSKITAVGQDWLELEGEGRGESTGVYRTVIDLGSPVRSPSLVNGSIT